MSYPMGGRPRLPAEDEYWEGLARRIETGAEPWLDRARTGSAWWTRGAVPTALAASAILAALGAWWWLPARSSPSSPTWVVAPALQPDDPLAGQILSSAGPPGLESLLVLSADPGAGR